jgi:hypothetical protein
VRKFRCGGRGSEGAHSSQHWSSVGTARSANCMRNASSAAGELESAATEVTPAPASTAASTARTAAIGAVSALVAVDALAAPM